MTIWVGECILKGSENGTLFFTKRMKSACHKMAKGGRRNEEKGRTKTKGAGGDFCDFLIGRSDSLRFNGSVPKPAKTG